MTTTAWSLERDPKDTRIAALEAELAAAREALEAIAAQRAWRGNVTPVGIARGALSGERDRG